MANLSAMEFFLHIQENEKKKDFWTDLANKLGTSERKLRATYIAAKITNGSDVEALRDLFRIYMNAPAPLPEAPEVLDAKGQPVEPKTTRLQRARLKAHGKRYDHTITTAQCENDLRRVQNLFPLKNLAEVDYLEHGLYSQDTWQRHYGTWLAFQRAAGVKLALPAVRYNSQVAKHVNLDVYRNYYEKSVLPYANLYGQPRKTGRFVDMVVGSDFHDKKSDPFALGVFLDTCKEMQPTDILLNGDIFDNYEFSRYDKDPRVADVVGAFQFVKKHIFAPLRNACPESRIIFMIGNHDWRVQKILAEGNPYIKELLSDVMGLTLADVFGIHEFEINLVTKWDLNFAATGQKAIEKQLRRNYKVFYDCYVAAHIKDYGFGLSGTSGHIHRGLFDTSKTEAAGHVSWMTTPSICRVEEDYVEGLDKAWNGFGVVNIDTAKDAVVQQLVMIPGDFTVVNGRRYVRSDYPELLV